MRLLFVINGLGTGGAERSLAEMLPRFEVRDLDCSVAVLFRRSEGVEQYVREAGVPVYWTGPGRWFRWVTALNNIAERCEPDLIFTTIFEADIVGRVVARYRRIPVVSSVVSTAYEKVRRQDPRVPFWKLRAAQILDGFTARHWTTLLHANSETTRDAAERSLGVLPGRIHVVHRGRDETRLGAPSPARRAAARCGLGIEESTMLLVNVGRQEFAKGQVHLLEALHLLATVPGRFELVVAGREGNASRDLRPLVNGLDLAGTVKFLGHTNDVGDLLAAADVFVFPSLYEGLPGSVIEAMAMSLPIIASDLPAIRELIEDGKSGLLVPPADPSHLAEGIRRLAADPELRIRLGSAARRVFEERFGIDRCVDGMIALFERALETHRGTARL